MSHTIAQKICSTKEPEFAYPYTKSTKRVMFHRTAQMQFKITTAMLTFFLSSIIHTSANWNLWPVAARRMEFEKLEFGGDAPAGNACLVQCVSLLP